jgi:hypothetical protein
MAIFNCVEPMHDLCGKKDGFNWNFAVKKGLGHHIVFPHVDSCLAVLVQMGPDAVFAAHINGFVDEKLDKASHQKAFASLTGELAKALNKRPINGAMAFGDIPNWKNYLGKWPWAPMATVYGSDKTCKNGVDVMLDLDAGTAKVWTYKKDRDFKKDTKGELWSGDIFKVVAGDKTV